MATSTIESLFGITPEALQAQRDAALQQQALQFAQLDPMQAAQAGFYMAGNRLGGALGGLLGAQDPELQRIKQRQALTQGIDQTDPVALSELANSLAKAGDIQGSQLAAAKALEIRKTLSEVYKNEQAGKASKAAAVPADIQKAQRVAEIKSGLTTLKQMEGNPQADELAAKLKAELDFYESATPKLTEMGRKVMEAYGFQPGTPEFQAKMQELLDAEKKGKEKGTGNVTIGGINVDTKKAGEEAGKLVGKDAAQIEGKYSSLDYLTLALDKLDKGIFSGLYGPAAMAAAKATSSNNPKVVNTEEFMAYLGNIVIPSLKEFGGNDSNEELKYLQRVLGGEQKLEESSIRNILKAAQIKIRRGIERTKAQAESAGKGQTIPLGPGASREAAQQGWSIRLK